MTRLSLLPALLVGIALRIDGQCPDGSPPPCGGARRTVAARAQEPPDAGVRARHMLLLPFRNVTRVAAQDWLTVGAPLMLAEALGQYRDLQIVPEERVTAARRRLAFDAEATLDATQLRRLAEETDGWTAVSGNVIAAGGQLRLSAQALDIPTARVLARAEATVATDADVRPAFDQLGVQLLEAVGVRSSSRDAAALTTQSVDAYRAYVLGVQQQQRSAYRDARASFQEAVRLDSTFALAWAKLAQASISASIFDLVQPANPIGRAISRATANASRLPPRQALLIRSMQLFIQGQPARARAVADSLVMSDPDDLDAREWLAFASFMDPTLDTGTRPVRLRSSPNQPVVQAKEILERDPGRRHVYSIPVSTYAMGAGLWGMRKIGVSGEYGSLTAMLMASMTRQEAVFVPVLQDTVGAMLASDFEKLPPDERRRLEARSADAAGQWLERWLAAGPEDAEAHLWASRLADVRGDYAAALREAVTAESLGVQSGWESVRSRRLRLLYLTGAHEHAVALADTLLTSGEFANLLPITLDQGRAYAAAIFILGKRWRQLSTLVDGTNPLFAGGQSRCINVVNDLDRLEGSNPGILRQVVDTAAAHYGAITTWPSLVGCVGNFSGTLLTDSTASRRTFGARMLAAKGDSLFRAGKEALGYRAVRQAWTADTTAPAHQRLGAMEWFMNRSRAMAFARTFTPVKAIVEADSAVFEFRATSAGPWELSYPDLPSRWAFFVELPTDSMTFTILARHDYLAGDGLKSGGLAEMLAGLSTVRVNTAPVNATGAASSARAHATPVGFAIVVRGPAVAELRRLAPRSATFRSEPCVAVTDGLCAAPQVAIEYRR